RADGDPYLPPAEERDDAEADDHDGDDAQRNAEDRLLPPVEEAARQQPPGPGPERAHPRPHPRQRAEGVTLGRREVEVEVDADRRQQDHQQHDHFDGDDDAHPSAPPSRGPPSRLHASSSTTRTGQASDPQTQPSASTIGDSHTGYLKPLVATATMT